jgi:hypothetical protein
MKWWLINACMGLPRLPAMEENDCQP